MKKTILAYVEKSLSAVLSTFTCLGMFLLGNFIGNIITNNSLSNSDMIVIALVSIIFTYLLTNFMLDIRYMRLGILAEEMEQEKRFMEEQEKFKKSFEESKGGEK